MKPIAISLNHFARGGGMESYALDLADYFAGQGGTVRVYANKFDRTLPQFAAVETVCVNQKWIPKKLRPFVFARQLDRLRRRADDTLIACNPSDHADLFICGGTHLGYLRGMDKRTTLLDRLAVRRNRSNYATTKRIMAHSQMMARELTELYGIAPEKIQTVYPPADTRRFYPQPQQAAAVRAQYGWRDDETVFLFPSTGHKRKGLDLLAAFFENTELPVRLAVAGSPLPRPMKNVQELGFCKDMPALYRAADYTVMASLYEPFGLVGVESVLCGTRVVFADDMGCTEVMTDEAGFFFSRRDSGSFAAAVARAVALKQAGNHKLTQPQEALTYAPDLDSHMRQLTAMLD